MLDKYKAFRSNFWFHLFTMNLRMLLGIGFVIGGLRKVNGMPFANPGQDGAFFELLDALHSNLIYYEFIGWAQFIAGALLITQRFATLGAVIYFPIILNIAVFTVFSVGTLTPWIASFMCLGTMYLLAWDYYKWVHLFSRDNEVIDMHLVIDFRSYDQLWLKNGIFSLILLFFGFSSLIFFGIGTEYTQATKVIFMISLIVVILLNIIVNGLSIWRRNK